MKNLNYTKATSNRLLGKFLGFSLTIATCATSHASSALASISVEPQWPINITPGLTILYTVTVDRTGEGNLDVELSCADLPPGVTARFSVNPVRFTGRRPTSSTSVLVFTCTNLVATDTWPFRVNGSAKQGTVTVTNAAAQNGSLNPQIHSGSSPTLALGVSGKSSVSLRGQGGSGQTYQIQATASLGAPSWTQLGSSTADGNGRFIFQESAANLPPVRFYRTFVANGN